MESKSLPWRQQQQQQSHEQMLKAQPVVAVTATYSYYRRAEAMVEKE